MYLPSVRISSFNAEKEHRTTDSVTLLLAIDFNIKNTIEMTI